MFIIYIWKEQKRVNLSHPPITTFKNRSADTSQINTHWCKPLALQGDAKWQIDFQHVCLQTLWPWTQTNNNWACLSTQTASIKPRVEGSGSGWKRSFRFSLISVLSFHSLVGFGGLSALSYHTPARHEALLVSIVRTERRACSKAAAVVVVRAVRVITASQQHGFPLTILCGCLVVNCLSSVSYSSLLHRSEPPSRSPVSWTIIPSNPERVCHHQLHTVCHRMALLQKQSNF